MREWTSEVNQQRETKMRCRDRVQEFLNHELLHVVDELLDYLRIARIRS